eukprot:1547976-Pleurochrysis_carterae.AAC.4
MASANEAMPAATQGRNETHGNAAQYKRHIFVKIIRLRSKWGGGKGQARAERASQYQRGSHRGECLQDKPSRQAWASRHERARTRGHGTSS